MYEECSRWVGGEEKLGYQDEETRTIRFGVCGVEVFGQQLFRQ